MFYDYARRNLTYYLLIDTVIFPDSDTKNHGAHSQAVKHHSHRTNVGREG